MATTSKKITPAPAAKTTAWTAAIPKSAPTTAIQPSKTATTTVPSTVTLWNKTVDKTALQSLITKAKAQWISADKISSAVNKVFWVSMPSSTQNKTVVSPTATAQNTNKNVNNMSSTSQSIITDKSVANTANAPVFKFGTESWSDIDRAKRNANIANLVTERMRWKTYSSPEEKQQDFMKEFQSITWKVPENTPDWNRTISDIKSKTWVFQEPTTTEAGTLTNWKQLPQNIIDISKNAYTKLIENWRTPDEAKQEILDKVKWAWYNTDSLSFPNLAQEAPQSAQTDLENLLELEKTDATKWLVESNEAAIEWAKTLTEEQNKIDAQQYGEIKSNIDSLKTYIDDATDPETWKLAQVISERSWNIDQAQTKMMDNANVIKDSTERIARLQSNDALQGIMRQYIAKWMTEEEARSQASADLNNQVMKERQVLLQAQVDTANMQNNIIQRAANAKDVISQAKDSNIKYNVGLEQTVDQLYNDAINNKYNSQKNAFATYVGTAWVNAFNDLRDNEKQELAKMMDINLASEDKRYAAMTFLSNIWAALWKNPQLAAQIVQQITGWTMSADEWVKQMLAWWDTAWSPTATAWAPKSSAPSSATTSAITPYDKLSTAFDQVASLPADQKQQKLDLAKKSLPNFVANWTITQEQANVLLSKLQSSSTWSVATTWTVQTPVKQNSETPSIGSSILEWILRWITPSWTQSLAK